MTKSLSLFLSEKEIAMKKFLLVMLSAIFALGLLVGCETNNGISPSAIPVENNQEKIWRETKSIDVKLWGSKAEAATGLIHKDWVVLYPYVKPSPALRAIVPIPLDSAEVSLGDLLAMGISAPIERIEGLLFRGERIKMQWDYTVTYDPTRRVMTFRQPPGALFEIGELEITRLVFRGVVLRLQVLRLIDGDVITPEADFIYMLNANWDYRKAVFQFQDWFWKGATFRPWFQSFAIGDTSRKLIGSEYLTVPVGAGGVASNPEEFNYEISLVFQGDYLNVAKMQAEVIRFKKGFNVAVKTFFE